MIEHVDNTRGKQEARYEWLSKQERRLLELQALIEDIHKPDFAKSVLKLGKLPLIDTKKLVIAGHRMGGATALLLGDKDKRVSAVVAMDPWLESMRNAIEPHWQLTQSLQKKAFLVLWTEEYFQKLHNDLNKTFETTLKITA